MGKKRQYTPEQKYAIVKEVLRGDKTMIQIGLMHGIAKSTISTWMKHFEQNASVVFELEKRKKEEPKESAQYLKGIIGDLTVENDILKKALSVWD